jgi:biopolymer transport protein ExbD
MRRYSQRQSLSSLSEINITPLLDLAFVLLIIFMITTPLLENSVNLVIPSSGEKNPVDATRVQTISIDRDEAIRLNNQVVDLDSLSAQLIELKRANPEVAVVIRPDRDLPVQKLVNLMDALQGAEITKVGIATKAEAK